jgi:hypothetical protein
MIAAVARKGSVARMTMFVILPGLAFVSGCSEKRIEVFPVSGKVVYQGKPPVGATVVLHPVNSQIDQFAPTGTVKGDGSFAITSYDTDDGAPQGEYFATIELYRYDKTLGGVGPNVLPRKYANWKTSPVKVNVGGSENQLQPITIN